jgi:hypothetical protein
LQQHVIGLVAGLTQKTEKQKIAEGFGDGRYVEVVDAVTAIAGKGLVHDCEAFGRLVRKQAEVH